MKEAKRWMRTMELVKKEDGSTELLVACMWPQELWVEGAGLPRGPEGRRLPRSGAMVRVEVPDGPLKDILIRLVENPEQTHPKWRPKLHTDPNTPPSPGDLVYIAPGTSVHGGLATVGRVFDSMSAGRMVPFINVNELPGHAYNWSYMAQEQEKRSKIYPNNVWAYPDDVVSHPLRVTWKGKDDEQVR